jgi:hypothetical protein
MAGKKKKRKKTCLTFKVTEFEIIFTKEWKLLGDMKEDWPSE